MATPKINIVLDEFAKRINDPDHAVVSLVDKMAYVNKAMFKLFNESWIGVGADISKFIKLFPELIRPATVTLSSSAYTIASPNLDYFTLHSGSVNGNYVMVVAPNTYELLKTNKFKYVSITKPVMLDMNNTIYLFPTSAGSALELLIVKQPLNPLTGAFLVKDGAYDSPFALQWNSKIAEIAEQIYKVDAGVM